MKKKRKSIVTPCFSGLTPCLAPALSKHRKLISCYRQLLAESLRTNTLGVLLPALLDLKIYPIQAENGGENLTGLPLSVIEPERSPEL